MCSGVLQHERGRVRVIDEFSLPDTDTESACDAFLETARGAGWDLRDCRRLWRRHGVVARQHQRKIGLAIVKHRLRHLIGPVNKVPRSNPAIKDTINAVRAILRSERRGDIASSIDPRLRSLDPGPAKTPSGRGTRNAHHALAWFRYFVEREYSDSAAGRGSTAGASGFQNEHDATSPQSHSIRGPISSV